MIVMGYQGIGKSTLAKVNKRYIDLECGSFWVDGKRDPEWYKPYGQMANHLSQQGYVVFISSHEVVRRWLEERATEELVIVCPSVNLKDEWIEKLSARYIETMLDKDYKTLMNAKDRYVDNIKELTSENPNKFKIVIIDNMDYYLKELL